MRPRPTALAAAAVLAVGATLVALGCTQQTISVDVRSLERSGRSAFLCLDAPGPAPGRTITDCGRRRARTPDDYGVGEDGVTTLPHLYALVTQTTRGEVAVIDMTTDTQPVLDQDPGVPGANFLPVGAQPIDIVATPGGTAAFVTVAEIGREGIFALPATKLRPCEGCAPPALSSWPACSLPSAPGDILLVSDPAGPDGERPTCDSAYGDPEVGPDGQPPARAAGDLSLQEGLGRQKLLVTLPDLGGFVVLDAQEVLDREAGSFGACTIERWVPLEVSLPLPPAAPPASHGPECVDPPVETPAAQPIAEPRPAGLVHSGDRLYIADLQAPVIHVVDLPTPCEPVERDPLLPTSAEEPSRIVTTSRLAVTPRSTLDFRRYLYAVDVIDGSTMVFDISDGARRTPLSRPRPEWNPFQPPDRIRFGAPVRDIAIIQRDVPVAVEGTGVAPEGIQCDPIPARDQCGEDGVTCGIEQRYQTADDYGSGAGPLKLRGTFAFLVLTSGQIAIIDIEDLDASCRGPRNYTTISGCPPVVPPPGYVPSPNASPKDIDGDGIPNDEDSCPFVANTGTDTDGDGIDDACDLAAAGTSNEASCNVVMPNTPRLSTYLRTSEQTGRHEPGLQAFPLLFDRSGTALAISEDGPILRATLPTGSGPPLLALAVGGELEAIDGATGLVVADDGAKHALVMNLEDPRAQIVDQAWAVIYEGALPGFGRVFAELRLSSSGEDEVYDSDGRFCARGVQSAGSLIDQGEAPDHALLMADYVQIASETPDQANTYWSSPGTTCTFEGCNGTFGSVSAPTGNRDLRILEAYQDRLLISQPPAGDEATKCCFPGHIQLNIRAGHQWVVQGQGTGFLHHVIEDPATGACRNSCEPRVARRNGRVRPTLGGSVVREGDPGAFQNPMFRFAITHPVCARGSEGCGGLCEGDVCAVEPERSTQFGFVTQGSFSPLVINLAARTGDLQPQAVRYVPATGEIAITDGSLEGLILVSPSTIDVSRQFY